jgi:hypothetical protein
MAAVSSCGSGYARCNATSRRLIRSHHSPSSIVGSRRIKSVAIAQSCRQLTDRGIVFFLVVFSFARIPARQRR